MPRRSLQFQRDHCYHLYNRGSDRQKILFERENYVYFLRLLQYRQYRLLIADLALIAYCLMPNHYHLLVQWVQCQGGDISKGMQSVSLPYTKVINHRFDRVGSLFQGPFKAIEVSTSFRGWKTPHNPIALAITAITCPTSFHRHFRPHCCLHQTPHRYCHQQTRHHCCLH